MLPTHVGMDRFCRQPPRKVGHAPHARGDGPLVIDGPHTDDSCSPRTWGWTTITGALIRTASMLPTHVGMDPRSVRIVLARCSAPHARGDGPHLVSGSCGRTGCSPRTWGWTARHTRRRAPTTMLPTHVGMDHRPRTVAAGWPHAPHARGDGPWMQAAAPRTTQCSPRTWGWTFRERNAERNSEMLPTHVGMDLHRLAPPTCCHPCSPRTWGWTAPGRAARDPTAMLPSHVGMDRRSCRGSSSG